MKTTSWRWNWVVAKFESNRIRASVFVMATACVLSCLITSVASAQQPNQDLFSPDRPAPRQNASEDRGPARGDREVLRMLDEAKQSVERKQFHAAVQLLQSVLDNDEDFFVEPSAEAEAQPQNNAGPSETTVVVGGIKSKATSTLKGLPAEGLAAYELDFGTKAADELADARESGDFERIASVARRFLLTKAGFDAVVLLAAKAADSNRPLESALQLDLLKGHPAAGEKRTPALLMRQAVCWQRAGRQDKCQSTLIEMKGLIEGKTRLDQDGNDAKSRGKLRLGGRDVSLFDKPENAESWLIALLGRDSSFEPRFVSSWLMPGGGPTRNESAVPASTIGGDRWNVSLFEHLAFDHRPEQSQVRRKQLEEVLARETNALRDEHRMAFPAAQPIIVGDAIIYRTLSDVTAVSLTSGELLWRSALSDATLVKHWNNRTFDARANELQQMQQLPPSLVTTLASHVRRRLFRDTAAGTLTTDGTTIFALEDLDATMPVGVPFRAQNEVTPWNKLVAYDAAGGKMLWEIGGPRGAKPTEFSGHFFLGAPLPLDGRLYCLAELLGDLRLLVLEQNEDRTGVTLEWSQSIYSTSRSVHMHPPRRLAGLSPAFSDGVLLCPTSSGAVVAIDTVRHQLLWGRSYRSTVPDAPLDARMLMMQRANGISAMPDDMDEQSRWLNNTPLIAEGRIVLAPRDSEELLCLDLLDGSQKWTLSRGEWLYPACIVDGRVILIGRDGVGAYRLKDGTPDDDFASVALEPSGLGVRVGKHYFLPLSNGEVATLDLKSGRVLARARLSEGRIPGNLVAGGGAVVSQNGSELIAFSKLNDIELRIAEGLATDPPDASALALRGELKLNQGEEEAGLADLRRSLELKPDPRVKSVLAATLLGGLRGNIALVRDRAEELDALTDDPRQRSEFLRLYSKALEQAGDKPGAFAQLVRLADSSTSDSELEPIAPAHLVRTDRAIRSRMMSLYREASAADRARFDELLLNHIALPQKKDSQLEDHLTRCLRHLAGVPGIEQALFAKLPKLEGALPSATLLERFAVSTDQDIAAKATAMLAMSHLNANRATAALPWIERLETAFAKRIALNDQTGHDLAQQLKRRDEVQALLTKTSPWTPGQIDVSRTPNKNPMIRQSEIVIDVISHSPSPFQRWSFEMDATMRTLTARDEFGQSRWKATIPPDNSIGDGGTRVVVNSGQLVLHDRWMALVLSGYFVVYVADDPTEAPRVVWQQALKSMAMGVSNPFGQRVGGIRRLPVNRGMAIQIDGSRGGGQFIGISREIVVYAIGGKLCGAELDTGRLAWSRHDVLPGLSFASVDDHAIAIQSNTMREISLLDVVDGSSIGTGPQTIEQFVLWVQGSRAIAQKLEPAGRVTEMRDLLRKDVVWTRTDPHGTATYIVNEDDVAVLETVAEGTQVTMLRKDDGTKRYQITLPYKSEDQASVRIILHRDADRDVIIVGTPTLRAINNMRAFPLESGSATSIPIDGVIAAVSRTSGEVLWKNTVQHAALVRQSAEQLPVMLFATRMFDVGAGGGNPFGGGQHRLSMHVLDKRTGRKIYSTLENLNLAGNIMPRLVPDPDNRQIVATFSDWQLNLDFPQPVDAAEKSKKSDKPDSPSK